MFEMTRARIGGLARWKNNTVHILGMVEAVLAFMLLVPAAVALYYGENWLIFAAASPILLILGTFQTFFFYSDGRMQPSMGILTLMLSWVIAFAAVSVPYLLHGFPWYDAIFESVSGFTAAGATVVPDVEALPMSLLFWRSFSQWVGGLAVVLIFMFLLPMMGIGGRSFINNELSGTDTSNYSVRMMSVAKSFIMIYIMFSAAEILMLCAAGVNLFESSCITMANISTGGLMVKNDSLASYSFAVQFIVLIFMFLGGTNFYLHYRVLYKREYGAYVKSQEFAGMFGWFAMLSALVCAMVLISDPSGLSSLASAAETLWKAVFTTVSFGTSTGYTITDYAKWPAAAAGILWIAGMFGSMSGSTGGGVKIYRLLILKDYISGGLYRMIHPNAIREVEFEGGPVNRDTVTAVIVVVMSFALAFAIGMIVFLVVEPGIGLIDSIGLCVASLGNVGTGLGHFGPSASLSDLTVMSKMAMAALMWIGRLEVFMVLILFTRAFWKDVTLSISKRNAGGGVRRRMRDSFGRR